MTVADSSSGTPGGALTVTAVNGVATFSGLMESQASSGESLVVSGAGLNPATTNSFTVMAAAADRLSVMSPDRNVLPGSPFGLDVLAEDMYGNPDPTFNGSITVALGTNSGGAVLGGTLTLTAVNGMAIFSDLTVNSPGNGYTVQATSAGLACGLSLPFDVTNDQLVVTAQPLSNVAAGGSLGLTIAAENSSGNVDTSFQGPVNVALIADQGSNVTLSGTLTATAANGVATFSGLTVDQAGYYALSASSNGVGSTATRPFTVFQFSTATSLTLSAASGQGTYGGTASPTATLMAGSTPVPNETVRFSLHGTVVGTATTNSNGVATFTGVSLVGLHAGTYTGYLAARFAGDINYAGNGATEDLMVKPATPTIRWPTPAAITQGKALGSTQLDAGASWTLGGNLATVPGKFTYTPKAGTVLHAGNNQTLLVTFRPTDSTDYTTATGNTTITVMAPASPSLSTVAVSQSQIALGGTATLTLTVLDANHNQEPGGGLKVVFKVSGSAGGTIGAVTDNQNGTYTATFTAGTKAGNETITATIGGKTATSKATLTVVPGPVSLSKSTVTVSTSRSIASGGTATVTLTVRDANGNLESSGLNVVFSLGTGAARGTFGTVAYKNGTYTATFTGIKAGSNTVIATINNQLVTSAAPAVTVVPGTVSLSQSTVTVWPSQIVPGGKTTATLTARDANGNQESAGGLVVKFGTGTGSAGGSWSPVKDNKNGTYTATFTASATATGSDTITATIGRKAVTSPLPIVTVAAGAGASSVTTQACTLTVDQTPAITSAAGTTFTVGKSGSFTIRTTPGFPATTTLTEKGTLPNGVSFKAGKNGTATLSGRASATDSVGTYTFTITASNGVTPAAVQLFTLMVVTANSGPLTGTDLVDAAAHDAATMAVLADSDGDATSDIAAVTVTNQSTTTAALSPESAVQRARKTLFASVADWSSE